MKIFPTSFSTYIDRKSQKVKKIYSSTIDRNLNQNRIKDEGYQTEWQEFSKKIDKIKTWLKNEAWNIIDGII